jgi:tetratricopeptide (TPR) repeat protein
MAASLRSSKLNSVRRLVLAIAALCAALGVCPAARAAPTEEQKQSAAAHFEKGVEFYREGSLDAALVEFERAYELIPDFHLLFNLAQIQTERHEYAAAVGYFEKYLQTGAEQIPEARRTEAQRELEKLRERVAFLMVESDTAGAQLFINDERVATLPLAQPVAINPGVCNVRVEQAGYLPARQQLRVAVGERPRVRLALQPAGRADAGSAAGSANYTPFWIATGATGAFAVATLGFGLTARAADQDLDDQLAQFPADPNKVDDARSRLRVYSALTDTCAALSVVGLGLAIDYLVAPPRASAGSQTDAARRSLRVVPGYRGIALHATF